MAKLINISELPLSVQGVFFEGKEEKFHSFKKIKSPTSIQNGGDSDIVQATLGNIRFPK